MINKEIKFVDMRHVIGQLALDYDIPILSFDNLVLLGKYAVIVYNLEQYSTKIPFSELCEYITEYIKTPFGRRVLENLSREDIY